MSALDALKARARELGQDGLTVYYAARDPRTPALARLLAIVVAAYAFSPIDLIPDFIPIIGFLDDLVLIPLGLALVVRLIPPEVMASSRAQAQQAGTKPINHFAAAVIVGVWCLAAWVLARWLLDKSPY